jgi:putative ABC transport system ATP-binding protein
MDYGGENFMSAAAQADSQGEPILKLVGVSMEYGQGDGQGQGQGQGQVKALHEVDLTVKKGEWLAIMGPSGSGKTTLMNVIGCLDRPSRGAVILEGQDVAGLPSRALTEIRRDRIGLIFQQFHLIPYLTALENVMVAQYYHSMIDEAEAMSALERVGLNDRAAHLPSQLSGGEQQRVCIARALINYPRLILADEPTGNLDEANEEIVLGLLRRLHGEGSTIIVVTHSPEVAARAEKTIVLEHGKIVKTMSSVRAAGSEI